MSDVAGLEWFAFQRAEHSASWVDAVAVFGVFPVP